MDQVPIEDGLEVVVERGDDDGDGDDRVDERPLDLELTALRDAFVDTFNGRDLDGLIALVAEDVDCPDVPGNGAEVLAEEVEGIWERSPGAVLTAATLDDRSCAVAWLPDEEGCWSRVALVCLDAADTQITVVAMPDDADGLDRADCDEPVGDELDEWLDWAEWDRGEETRPVARREQNRRR